MTSKCDDVEPLLTRYLLGDLGESEQAGVKEHLAQCGACRAAVRDLEPALELARRALESRTQLDLSLDGSSRTRIRDAIRRGRVIRFTVHVAKIAAVAVIGFGLVALYFSSLAKHQARPGRVETAADGSENAAEPGFVQYVSLLRHDEAPTPQPVESAPAVMGRPLTPEVAVTISGIERAVERSIVFPDPAQFVHPYMPEVAPLLSFHDISVRDDILWQIELARLICEEEIKAFRIASVSGSGKRGHGSDLARVVADLKRKGVPERIEADARGHAGTRSKDRKPAPMPIPGMIESGMLGTGPAQPVEVAAAKPPVSSSATAASIKPGTAPGGTPVSGKKAGKAPASSRIAAAAAPARDAKTFAASEIASNAMKASTGVVIRLTKAGEFSRQPAGRPDGKRSFSFTRMKYQGGDWNGHPDALNNLLLQAKKWSKQRIKDNPMSTSIDVGTDQLLTIRPPVIFMTGQKDFTFSASEIKNLRDYLARHGRVWVDSAQQGKDSPFDIALRREMKKVFPDRAFETVNPDHPMFDFYFSGIGLPPGLGGARAPVEMIQVEGEPAVIYTLNGYSALLAIPLNDADEIDYLPADLLNFLAENRLATGDIQDKTVVNDYKFSINIFVFLISNRSTADWLSR